MGPFHIPWSSFAAVFLLLAAIVLALSWAAHDRARDERKGEGRRR